MKSCAWLLIAIGLLFSSALCSKTDKTVLYDDRSVIQAEESLKVYTLNIDKSMDITVELTKRQIEDIGSSEKALYLTMDTLDSVLEYSINGKKKAIENRYIVADRFPLIKVINKHDIDWEALGTKGKIFIKVKIFGNHPAPKAKGLLSISCSSTLKAPIGAHYKVFPSKSTSLAIETVTTSSDKAQNLKFVVHTPDKEKDSQITGYLIRNEEDRSSSTPLVSYEKGRLGAVVDPSSDLKCSGKEPCVYQVNLEMHKIDEFHLYLGEYIENEPLEIDQQTIGLVTETDPIKSHDYWFKQGRAINPLVWKLIVIEGQASLYANIGFVPQTNAQFGYSAFSETAKSILINDDDLNSVGQREGNTKIYARVHCPGFCRYVLSLGTYINGMLEIQAGYSETGKMKLNETKQHLLYSRQFQKEDRVGPVEKKLSVKLQLFNGNADLYIKNCKSDKECSISDKDIATPGADIKYIKSNNPVKIIPYPMFCSEAKNATLPTGFDILSDSCAVVIALKTDSVSQGQNELRYELSVEDELESHLTNVGHHEYIHLLKDQKKNYKLNYNMAEGKKKTLVFALDLKYGQVDVCIKKLDGNTDSSASCIYTEKLDTSLGILAHSFKTFKIGDGSQDISGAYQVELSATELSGLSLGSYEINRDEANHNLIAKEIKAGLQISEHLDDTEDGQYYVININKNKKIEDIHIRLTPLEGDFILAVRTDGQKPTPDQEFLTSEGNSLVITKSDPMWREEGTYFVGVFPVVDSIKVKNGSQYSYKLKWTHTGKHSILTHGVPEYGELINTEECFLFPVDPKWTSLTVMKHSLEDLDLYALLGNPHDVPSLEKHDFKASAREYGFEVSGKDIQQKCTAEVTSHKKCNMYMCMKGEKGAHFMLAFTPETTPITLLDSRAFFGPLPTHGHKLFFFYHPTKTSPVDVEEFGAGMGASIQASLIEQPGVGEKVNFPQEKIPPEELSRTLHFARDDIEKLKKPLLAITVDGRANPELVQDFEFKEHFALEAGYGVKELSRRSVRKNIGLAGEMQYFYFYNADPTNSIHVGLNSLNGGDADIYITRGKESRPTPSHFLAKSSGAASGTLELSIEKLNAHGFSSPRGFYVVAVKANTDIRYTLKWDNRKADFEIVGFNTNYKKTVAKGEILFVELSNIYNSDVELLIDTHGHNAKIYWSSEKSVSDKDLFDRFPSSKNHMAAFDIHSFNSNILTRIRKDFEHFCTNCKFLYSIQPEMNDDEEETEVEFRFSLIGKDSKDLPELVGVSKFAEGIIPAGDAKLFQVYMFEKQAKQIQKMNIDVQMTVGDAQLKIGTSKEVYDDEPGLFKVSAPRGFTRVGLQKVDFNQLKLTSGTQTTKMYSLFVKIQCNTPCKFKLFPHLYDQIAEIKLNHQYEGIFDESKERSTFYMPIDKPPKRLTFSFNIDQFLLQPYLEVKDPKQFEEMVVISFTTDKKQIGKFIRRTVQRVKSELDHEDNQASFEVIPETVPGYYVVQIRDAIKQTFKYTFQWTEGASSIVSPGKTIVNYISPADHSKVHSFQTESADEVFMMYQSCFGQLSFEGKGSIFDSGSKFNKLDVQPEVYNNLGSTKKNHEQIYIRANKDMTIYKTEAQGQGYLDYTHKAAVYNLQMYEAKDYRDLSKIELNAERTRPWVDLSGGHLPYFLFRPLKISGSVLNRFEGKIKYHVVISKDPSIIEYYSGCKTKDLVKVIKKGYKLKDVIEVIDLGINPKPSKEILTQREYIKTNLKSLESGLEYFATVVAEVYLRKSEDSFSGLDGFFQVGKMSSTVLYGYDIVKFEYKSHWYPLELLASTVGLLFVMFSVCVLGTDRCLNYFNKARGYSEVKGEVDSQLEEYYLQIKADFEANENHRKEQKEAREKKDSSKNTTELGNSATEAEGASESKANTEQPPQELI